MLRRSLPLSLFFSLLSSFALAAPASQSSQDAWPLYLQAIQRVAEGDRTNIMSPAASNLMYEDYPPYPAEWHKMETQSYAFNAPARASVHEARSRDIANWPALAALDGKLDMTYLNGCRNVANEVADAALYQHLHGDDAAAIESLRDLNHLADLLERPAPSSVIQSLVAVGIRMIATNRLEVISAGASLTSDAADPKKLQGELKVTRTFNI